MTNQVNETRAGSPVPTSQPGRSAKAALRILQMCPLLPADAFRHLAGFRSTGGAYRRLENLRQAGLAEVERVELGYLLADRPVGLWRITGDGQHVLEAVSGIAHHTSGSRGLRKRRSGGSNVTSRVAAYRLLAFLVAEWNADGRKVELRSWEHPWLRIVCCLEHGKLLRVELPAGAVLAPQEPREAEIAVTGGESMRVVVIPDLGAAPVAHYREKLRRLFAYREASGDLGTQLVVATVDPDGDDARCSAWLSLVDRLARRRDAPAFSSRVVSWVTVQSVLSGVQRGDSGSDSRPHQHSGGGVGPSRRRRVPGRAREQLLHLIGRHPFLTAGQLAQLLGTTTSRIRRLEAELVRTGWLKRIEFEELHSGAIGWREMELVRLGLVEITAAGQRRLAASLCLDQKTATRYHGLIGAGRSQAGKRRRLLRTLAHTLGANAVFVALAVAAGAVRRAGGSDALTQWQGAAACERKICKPDGYGCFVRDGVPHGFFLEYDRGTERARHYAAKIRAYYKYRDSGQAGRDYRAFPTVLFVTTQPIAEQRLSNALYRADFIRATKPLRILTTTVDLIQTNPEGILGRIWRTAARPEPSLPRQYWLPGRPPRDFSNVHASAATQLRRR